MSNNISNNVILDSEKTDFLAEESIQSLKEKKRSLEQNIKNLNSQKGKEFHIRNFKRAAHTANFLTPFALTCGAAIGLTYMIGGGLPFVKDPYPVYKVHSLDYDSTDYVSEEEDYVFPVEQNTLVIYSPWEKQDNHYIRTKREYKVDELTTLDLYQAVLNEDYSYIEENLPKYTETIQKANQIREDLENDYIVRANLHFVDKSDSIPAAEDDLTNIAVTVADLVLGLGFGAVIAKNRQYNLLEYTYQMRKAGMGYDATIQSIRKSKKQLEKVNQKISTFSKTKVN